MFFSLYSFLLFSRRMLLSFLSYLSVESVIGFYFPHFLLLKVILIVVLNLEFLLWRLLEDQFVAVGIWKVYILGQLFYFLFYLLILEWFIIISLQLFLHCSNHSGFIWCFYIRREILLFLVVMFGPWERTRCSSSRMYHVSG